MGHQPQGHGNLDREGGAAGTLSRRMVNRDVEEDGMEKEKIS